MFHQRWPDMYLRLRGRFVGSAALWLGSKDESPNLNKAEGDSCRFIGWVSTTYAAHAAHTLKTTRLIKYIN